MSRAHSILIVDDDQATCTVVKTALHRAGHSTACASGEEQVTSLLKRLKFDLVITDVIMPEFDGIKVIEAVKRHQPGAAIMAMSGGGSCVTRELCLMLAKGAGGMVSLEKPFHLDDLLDAVATALNKSAAQPVFQN
jgi:DNA-binding NtrC family response regulator